MSDPGLQDKDYLLYWVRCTAGHLTDNWRAVDAVATYLLERQTLSAAEVIAIMTGLEATA